VSGTRADLLALTPQAVTALSNPGLVKRAQKELEAGKGPRLEEAPDGTVSGTFEDGAVARLPPGKPLRDCPCTCASTGVCRHRVAVALAYPAFAAASGGASSGASGAERAGAAPSAGPAVEEAPWSPGAVEDAALTGALSRRALERAGAMRARGYVARVRRGTFRGDDVPAALLATCTVRFLVPRALAHARCDCAAGTGCEHVALAVWAFREADRQGAPGDAAEVMVEVATAPAVGGSGGAAALGVAADVAGFLLLEGVQHAAGGAGARFALARAQVEGAGLAWVRGALEEAEELLAAYHARSARYAPARAAAALGEVLARTRVARAGGGAGEGALPVRTVLGADQAPETKLDHLRLVSLGVRLSAEGRERGAEVLLVDPAAAGLLVLRRAWTYGEGETPEAGEALGRRQGLPGVSLAALAAGQLVATGATRLPSRQVVFSTRGLQRVSVTPQTGAWEALPVPLRVEDVGALEAELRRRPPRFLRPRLLAEGVHVLAVSRVAGVEYAAGAQALRAEVEDAGGRPFGVELAHRGVAPGALDALAAALGGRPGAVRFVAGDVRRTGHGLVVEPVAVACEGGHVVSLDVAPVARAEGVRAVEDARPAPSPLAAALLEAEGCLADGVHQGLRHASPAWPQRLAGAATRCQDCGLGRVAEALGRVGGRLGQARASGSDTDEAALVEAWADAALRVAVAVEQLGGD
jgi:hypothetical protein